MGLFEERLKQAREYAGFTQLQLSKKIGISLRTLTNHEKEASNVSVILAQKIAHVCKVNDIWLLTGQGSMLEKYRPDNVTKIVVEHQDLVTRFKNPERAKDINERLIKIEEVSEELYNKADIYIRGLYDAVDVIDDSKKNSKDGKDIQGKSTG